MRYAPCLALAVVAGTVAACQPYYRDGYRYGPSYAYAPAYGSYPSTYGYSYYPRSHHYYSSKWDYYRHYNGSSSPPERYP